MSTTVINVIFRAAEVGFLRLKENYALYEASENLQIGMKSGRTGLNTRGGSYSCLSVKGEGGLSFSILEIWRLKCRDYGLCTMSVELNFIATASSIALILSASIERALEDHEVIGSVLEAWPAKNKPVLLLKPFPTKNELWTKHSPVSIDCT